jgi:predicted DNA-binding transcriptional regulator AlpA
MRRSASEALYSSVLNSNILQEWLLHAFGPILRPRDLQLLLGVSKSTVYRWIHGEGRSGLSPMMVVPRSQRIRVPTRHFVRWLMIVTVQSELYRPPSRTRPKARGRPRRHRP